MKKILSLVLISIFLTLNSQIIKDTLFLEKDLNHKVFIEKKITSDYYKQVVDFKGFETVNSTKKIESFNIKSKWIRVYYYENNYFLYAPCDWMYDLKYVIDDNKIQIKSEEINSFKIYSKKRYNDKVVIKYKTPNSKNSVLLIIKPFDKTHGIYKFISVCEGVTNEYLMITPENYKSFDIIVNECVEKTKEFDFK